MNKWVEIYNFTNVTQSNSMPTLEAIPWDVRKSKENKRKVTFLVCKEGFTLPNDHFMQQHHGVEKPLARSGTEDFPLSLWVKKSESVHRSVMSNSLQPHGRKPARLLCPWSSPGNNNTRGGCYSLLQGIFPTYGSNLSLLHCRQTLRSEPPGKPLPLYIFP